MVFLMAGQPSPENWTALASFVMSGLNLCGLGFLFVWVAETFKRKRD